MAEAYSREPGYRENIEIALGGLLGGGRSMTQQSPRGLFDFFNYDEPIYPLVGDPRIGTGSYSLPRVRQDQGLPPVPAYRFPSSGQRPVERSSISSYSPSFVENKTAEFAEQLGGDYRARKLAEQGMGLLEMLPGTGDIAAGTDAAHAFEQGRNIEGGLLAGMTALGAIPIVGPAIRKGGKAAMRGIINTPDLRLMDRDSAISAARSEPHLIQDKSGQYIGGPRGVKTTKKLAAMRAKFDAEVEAGLSGGDWYAILISKSRAVVRRAKVLRLLNKH